MSETRTFQVEHEGITIDGIVNTFNREPELVEPSKKHMVLFPPIDMVDVVLVNPTHENSRFPAIYLGFTKHRHPGEPDENFFCIGPMWFDNVSRETGGAAKEEEIVGLLRGTLGRDMEEGISIYVDNDWQDNEIAKFVKKKTGQGDNQQLVHVMAYQDFGKGRKGMDEFLQELGETDLLGSKQAARAITRTIADNISFSEGIDHKFITNDKNGPSSGHSLG